MKSTNQAVDCYLSHFEAFERTLNGESQSSLHQLRRAAMGKLSDSGFPTTRHEEWKYTNITPITKIDFKPVFTSDAEGIPAEQVRQFSFGTQHQLVFVDGQFSSERSTIGALPLGVFCGSLAAAVKEPGDRVQQYLGRQVTMDETPFVSLNTAFLNDGAFIHIPDGVVLEEAIHLLFIASGRGQVLIAPRNLIVLGKRSQASVVESYVSLKDSQYLTDAVTEIVLGDESVLEHDKLQKRAAMRSMSR